MVDGAPKQSESLPDYSPPQSVEELLRRYAAGERYFARADIPDGSSLRSQVLVGADFNEAYLTDLDFRDADLRGCRFEGCNVKVSDFRGADLRGASFRGAAVCGALWEGANLEGVSFNGSDYYGWMLTDDDDFPNSLPTKNR